MGYGVVSCDRPVKGFAEENAVQDSYDRKGWAIGLGGVYGIEVFRNTRGDDYGNAPGFHFRFGYRLMPQLAIEGMVERIDSFKSKEDRVTSSHGFFRSEVNGRLKIETWTTTAQAKVFPFTGRFQPYGLAGFGFMYAEGSGKNVSKDREADVAYRLGGGIDAYLTEKWVFYLEGTYVVPRGDVNDLNYVSLGAGFQLRF